MDAYERAVEKVKLCKPCRPCAYPVAIPGPVGPTGPIGPQGVAGEIGPTGPAPNFIIGSVTTGAPGTSASVTITPMLYYQNTYYKYMKGDIS